MNLIFILNARARTCAHTHTHIHTRTHSHVCICHFLLKIKYYVSILLLVEKRTWKKNVLYESFLGLRAPFFTLEIHDRNSKATRLILIRVTEATTRPSRTIRNQPTNAQSSKNVWSQNSGRTVVPNQWVSRSFGGSFDALDVTRYRLPHTLPQWLFTTQKLDPFVMWAIGEKNVRYLRRGRKKETICAIFILKGRQATNINRMES